MATRKQTSAAKGQQGKDTKAPAKEAPKHRPATPAAVKAIKFSNGATIKTQLGKGKIAIVGYAPSSRMLAPYNDESWDIWGVNELYMVAPRVDVLFELHHREWLTQKERNPDHLKWLKEAKVPVMMLEHYADIPHSVPYPKDDIMRRFGGYFTNSISWMLALAIFAQPAEIGLWGVDMATTEEYQGQRPSVEFFVGWAKGAGIKVTVPPQCDLLKAAWLYGYQDREITQMCKKMKARIQELQSRAQQYQGQIQNLSSAMNQMLGAKDDVDYWMRTWVYGEPLKGQEDVSKKT